MFCYLNFVLYKKKSNLIYVCLMDIFTMLSELLSPISGTTLPKYSCYF